MWQGLKECTSISNQMLRYTTFYRVHIKYCCTVCTAVSSFLSPDVLRHCLCPEDLALLLDVAGIEKGTGGIVAAPRLYSGIKLKPEIPVLPPVFGPIDSKLIMWLFMLAYCPL